MQPTDKQTDIITFYTVETYAFFPNINKSILGTNSFLEKFGYKFLHFDLEELEKKFSDLFSLPKNFQSEVRILLEDSDISISTEFYQAITNNSFFGSGFIMDKEIFFLKRIMDFDQEAINNIIKNTISIKVFGELQRFVDNLRLQFRLFKKGDIFCPIQFQISKENRNVTPKYSGRNRKTSELKKFNLSQGEIETFANSFKTDFKANPLTELAIQNFNLSYEISDLKTRYITLMTCLESLFNQNRDQIAHTISKHLALMISNSNLNNS